MIGIVQIIVNRTGGIIWASGFPAKERRKHVYRFRETEIPVGSKVSFEIKSEPRRGKAGEAVNVRAL